MSFAKLMIAWVLSTAIYAMFVQGRYAGTGKPHSGFGEALLGLGALLAIPSFLFALILGWPTMSLLARQQPGWLLP